jgi:hypothetical protein
MPMTRTRTEIEKMLTVVASAGRDATGSRIAGAFAMDDADKLYFVTVGGGQTAITPRMLGECIERVGQHLQGRTPAKSHAEMVNVSKSGAPEPLDLDKPFTAAEMDATDDQGDEGTITGAQMVRMLEISHTNGVNAGKALAYADVLGDAETHMKTQEEALARAKAGSDAASMCMGEIMALRVLLDRFSGAVEHFNDASIEATRELRRYVVTEGIIDPERLTTPQAREAVREAMDDGARKTAQG